MASSAVTKREVTITLALSEQEAQALNCLLRFHQKGYPPSPERDEILRALAAAFNKINEG